MLLSIIVALFFVQAWAQFPNGRRLEGPIPEMCAIRTIHETSPLGQNYFFQWRGIVRIISSFQSLDWLIDWTTEQLDEEDWLGVRNFCRTRCMDAVSLETSAENEWIKDKIENDYIEEIWTSGRLCDFKVCSIKRERAIKRGLKIF